MEEGEIVFNVMKIYRYLFSLKKYLTSRRCRIKVVFIINDKRRAAINKRECKIYFRQIGRDKKDRQKDKYFIYTRDKFEESAV